MYRLSSFRALYAVLLFSCLASAYFVFHGSMDITGACSINISLLALAVSSQMNRNIQTEKIKEIVRDHLLRLYDTVALTARWLKANLGKMEIVYCDETLVTEHLNILHEFKDDLTRLSSRLSFFIQEQNVSEACEKLTIEIESVCTTVEYYLQNEMQAKIEFAGDMRKKGATAEEIRLRFEQSLREGEPTLNDIRRKEQVLVEHLERGELMELLLEFRSLDNINLN